MARPDITAFIKANADGFHASMGRIRKDAKLTASSSGSAFKALTDKLRGGVAGALAGVGIGAAITLVINQARKAVDEIQEVEKAAKTAGVAFEAFQELSYAARKNLVSVEALTDGLKEMQLRVDEVVKTGKGPAAESLGRLGYSAKELAVALKQPDKLFEDIIGRMKSLDKAAQIRVADEIFGGSAGEQFVRLLDETRGSIADNRAEAQKLGLVIGEDLLKRVNELDVAWGEVSDTISTRVKTAVLEAIAAVGTFIDSLHDLENQTGGTVQSAIADRVAEIKALKAEMASNTSVIAQAENRVLAVKLEDLEADLKVLMGEKARRTGMFGPNLPSPGITPSTLGQSAGSSTLGKSTGSSKISDADRQRKKILELIDALEFESRTLKMNETDQRIANELRKAGAQVTPEQTATIIRLVQANEAEKRSRQAANDELERQGRIYEQFGGEVESTLEGLIGKSLTLEQALIKVAFAAVRAMLDINRIGGSSGGGIGGLIGAALSRAFGNPFAGSAQASSLLTTGAVGLFARGGVSDKPAIFGEGPMVEAAVPLPDGRRIPVDLRGAGGNSISAPVTISIDATGADAAGLARLERELAGLKRDLPARIVTTVQDARRRRVLQ